MKQYWLFPLLALMLIACEKVEKKETATQNYDWSYYLGGDDRNHFAPLDQINVDNVSQLELAWQYQSENGDSGRMGQIQCNPLIINGILYGTSPTLKVFALNAATGERLWEFDHQSSGINYGMNVNRGITYHHGYSRIFFSAGPYLYALNAEDGTLVEGFGENGKVSMRKGLTNSDSENLYVVATSPGAIYENKLIMGFRTLEAMGAAPGKIRAFDVNTGEVDWTFSTIPQPGEYGYHTWPEDAYTYTGGANSWAGVSLDNERGIVYVPTGSAVYDFYGANRKGANLFANCVLALDANTGDRIWHYQIVHHDIWDRDVPATPNLIDVMHKGSKTPALAQITKHGYVYVFNRVTGKPLFPIKEVPVPLASDLIGEEPWPTQPLPVKPPPFARQIFTEDMISRIDSANYPQLLDTWEETLSHAQFIPPSKQGTMIFPGFDGGGEWGGAAVDPQGIMYVNSSEMPWILSMVETGVGFAKEDEEPKTLTEFGKQVYKLQCAVCHGDEMQGDGGGTYPSLIGVEQKYDRDSLMALLNQGKGMMPALNHIDEEQKLAVTDYLLGVELDTEVTNVHELGMDKNALPYRSTGYNKFVDSNGNPAVEPPWGTLTAIDLNQGEILWQVPLGEYEELTARGIPKTGAENYGGPVVTNGDIIFIAASKDEHIRAFDKNTGEEIWKYKLPAGGYATPATYMVDGVQYLVIACGGDKMGTSKGDSYLAFKLRDN
ncbi:MAG: PQQ-binding-like beta-propeller repeat protein [Cyclobacteriaceae bacterium]